MSTRSAILAAVAALLTPDGAGNILAGQSPAQFDSSLKLITSAWVQQRGVSYGGQVVLSGANLLTAAGHAGKECTITSAAAQTLPLAATCPPGTVIHFLSNVGGASVNRQGTTDTIAVGNGASTPTVSLGAGDTLTLMSDGGSSWVAIGGSTQLGASGVFGASLAGAGYQKLPSGLIIQWNSSFATGAGYTAWTFPIAFPATALAVFGMINAAGLIGGTQVSCSGMNATSASVASSTSSAYAGANVQLLAIGH